MDPFFDITPAHKTTCFTPFNAPVTGYALPPYFTFPFYYQPHPLCLLAAKELQSHLTHQTQWQHNFGLGSDTEQVIGKMFGVLVVQDADGHIGYLSAFSGKLAQQNHLPKFVPPVFDMLTTGGFFLPAQQQINQVSEQLETVQTDPDYLAAHTALTGQLAAKEQHLAAFKQSMQDSRLARKSQRASAQQELEGLELTHRQQQLNQQSIEQKIQLGQLKSHWDAKVLAAQDTLNIWDDEITRLKIQRRNLSADLQQKLFEQYRFLNANEQHKSLAELFVDSPSGTPPAGAGECAAPKLLHYAYLWNLRPLAMAEFWWGESPKSELRRHQNFYPACIGKCQPILNHMLEGLAVDENLLLQNSASDQAIDIIYQDDVMLIVNKPAQLLSVPGKTITDSVYSRIKGLFPHATGPLIVHRLDMSTSGLMVIALTKQAHKNLQKQFISRGVEKRYVALLDGLLNSPEGEITLPLCGDYYDRPRQRVCEDEGKAAQTRWQVLARDDVQGQTKVYLYPKTGRTHQLRVHCAHVRGLNMPIVGDDLYGQQGQRLHLHAQSLKLTHPVSKKVLDFAVQADF
ncbi:MAG: tRNA pseudouridine32 synthase/23S rRNA pseudouridine746 synthase [Paraglaciecola sp.]|jgi:tRNA pseudouridine32 synthase/23S rRNA pseudouridine746 synthase